MILNRQLGSKGLRRMARQPNPANSIPAEGVARHGQQTGRKAEMPGEWRENTGEQGKMRRGLAQVSKWRIFSISFRNISATQKLSSVKTST